MFAAFNRGLPLVAALVLAFTGAAHGAAIGPSSPHREAVDEHNPYARVFRIECDVAFRR